ATSLVSDQRYWLGVDRLCCHLYTSPMLPTIPVVAHVPRASPRWLLESFVRGGRLTPRRRKPVLASRNGRGSAAVTRLAGLASAGRDSRRRPCPNAPSHRNNASEEPATFGPVRFVHGRRSRP